MIHRFLSVVPKSMRFCAKVIVACSWVIGLVAGYYAAGDNGILGSISVYSGVGLLAGLTLGAWLLCLGYVFGDAQRRAMKPILWTLVAAFFPHLMGFLLYFAVREPITSTCPACGGSGTPEQRFCSRCGRPQNVSRSDIHSSTAQSFSGSR